MSMHIDAKVGDIAKTVIVAGDPDRVTYIAEKYLENPICVNNKRGALCYTGSYEGHPISVMATGMGIPSMLIYATELFRDYDCDAIIRVGTSAGYKPEMERHDIVLSQAASHTSGLNDGVFGGTFCPIADFGLLSSAHKSAKDRGIRTFIGNTVCNDRIYRLKESYRAASWSQYGILCSEMEGAALYTAAAQFGKKALMIVTILSKLVALADGGERPEPLPEVPGKSIDGAILVALDTAKAFEESR